MAVRDLVNIFPYTPWSRDITVFEIVPNRPEIYLFREIWE
jgi:hypothetical protein